MNKKINGVILIIFGGYLLIGNTIFSILFNYAGTIGFYIPLSPEVYWASWWCQYGSLTIAIAAAGLILIILGIRIFIKRNEISEITAEANKIHQKFKFYL